MKNVSYFICSLIISAMMMTSCKDGNPSEAAKEMPRTVDYPEIAVEYPETRVDTSVYDDYHGTEVSDPYRWLEIDTAAAVEAWVDEQNEVTFGYLDEISFRDDIKARYKELFNYEKVSSPRKVGDYYFFSKNDGLQNQSVYYYQKGLDGDPEVFLDPNSYSEDGTTAVGFAGFSKDDKYVVISIQEAGSDWRTFKIMDVETKEELDDKLEWVKFSGASWAGDGFYYSRYPAPAKGTEFSGANKFHSIYYHKLGESQDLDKLVYRDEEKPLMYHSASVTEDEEYLIMNKQTGTDGFETYYMKLNEGDQPFVKLFSGFKNKNSVIKHKDGKFLVRTDIDAPNYRLISVDISNPEKENWTEIIPESKNLLNSVSTGGGYLFANYLEKANNHIYRFNEDGTGKTEIELPGTGSAGGFYGKEDDTELFYSFTSFLRPPSIFKYDVESGNTEPFYETKVKNFNPEDFVEKQVTYKSKDGTDVTMFVVHKKDIVMDGMNPTYLYAYGGFNISLTPSFSSSRLVLLENGGVFAMPNLRGGGEYGEEWHKGGMLEKKQNVFDDFIAAAEYLISENYTSSEKLGIAGGSNGGLLVGACMTQRPDLYAVAFPAVGVLDMLRYHKFTVGWGWVPEYGSSDDPEQFEYLYKYSPLHNLKKGTEYPATMITTADHDDRVVPAHSFKFAAALQEAHAGSNPVLIRIAKDAGHGAGKPTSKIIEEQADLWSFFFYSTDSPVVYDYE